MVTVWSAGVSLQVAIQSKQIVRSNSRDVAVDMYVTVKLQRQETTVTSTMRR
jgi:hypothetical protein